MDDLRPFKLKGTSGNRHCIAHLMSTFYFYKAKDFLLSKVLKILETMDELLSRSGKMPKFEFWLECNSKTFARGHL